VKAPDFWLRRSAVLAFSSPCAEALRLAPLRPLRRPPAGREEFFIRKALGWVLREVSKKDRSG